MEWLSPEGINASNGRALEIMNIQRSAAGIYTCVATRPLSGATMNSTVNVTVLCEELKEYSTLGNAFTTCLKYIFYVTAEFAISIS